MTDLFGHAHNDLTESVGEPGMKEDGSGLTVSFGQAKKPSPNQSVMCRGARKSAGQRLVDVCLTDSIGGTTYA
jgi:hypothetical protein